MTPKKQATAAPIGRIAHHGQWMLKCGGEQRIDVRADGVEGDVSEIQQACEAHDDVQAQGQQHEEDGEVRDANPRRARLDQHERQDQQCRGDQRHADPLGLGVLANVGDDRAHGQ